MPQQPPLEFELARERLMKETRAQRTGKWEWNGRCSSKCALNPVRLENLTVLVEEMFNTGETDRAISKRLANMEYPISWSSVRRHRANHLYLPQWHDVRASKQNDAAPSPQVEDEPLEPVENIAALRQIIAVGMKKIKTGKITPELVVKAIDLEERLTRGTKTSALMDAISGVFAEEDGEDEAEETPMQKAARLSALDSGE